MASSYSSASQVPDRPDALMKLSPRPTGFQRRLIDNGQQRGEKPEKREGVGRNEEGAGYPDKQKSRGKEREKRETGRVREAECEEKG